MLVIIIYKNGWTSLTRKWFSVTLKNALLNSFYWTVFRLLFLKIHNIQILLLGSHISLSYRPDSREEGSFVFWIATSWYTRKEIREKDKKNRQWTLFANVGRSAYFDVRGTARSYYSSKHNFSRQSTDCNLRNKITQLPFLH